MTKTALRFISFSLCCFSVLSVLAAQEVPDKQTVLSKARNSYYNLRDQGMSSFQCQVTPNWNLLLQNERKQDPEAADAAIRTLSQIHFVSTLAADNSVKLTHNELTGQSAKMMDALKQVYGGMEQMASGFFDTWKLFMLSPPFPAVSGNYQLANAGSQYRLSYKEDTAAVVTTMGRDFAIANMQIITPEFNSTIQPTFTRTAQGLRLSGYEASYQSQKPEEATHLLVSMDYQDVQGLSMLNKLNLSGTYGGSPFAVELAFSDCQVTRR